MQLRGKADARFVELCFKAIREHYHMKTVLTVAQFLDRVFPPYPIPPFTLTLSHAPQVLHHLKICMPLDPRIYGANPLIQVAAPQIHTKQGIRGLTVCE